MRHARLLAASVCAFGALLALAALPARAVDPTQMPNPQLEARYIKLTHEFRCPVCQNETLADSGEQVAAEVRAQIRTMLLAGKSDRQIRDYLVSRYSEFILFKPEYSLRNAWLWLSPAVLLVIGIVVALRVIRARAALVDQDDQVVDQDDLAVDEGPIADSRASSAGRSASPR